jgi:hypothetical protein
MTFLLIPAIFCIVMACISEYKGSPYSVPFLIMSLVFFILSMFSDLKVEAKTPEKAVFLGDLCPTCKQPLHNSDDYFFPSTANTNAVHTTH